MLKFDFDGTWIAFCSPHELQQTFLSTSSEWKVEALARLEPYNRTRMDIHPDEAVCAVVAILDFVTG